jgi:general secretion pathway protein I
VRSAGFTLIEVLVALVIVAVGMGAVMSALTSSASTLSFLRDETFAQWVALNQIATIRLSGQVPSPGNSSGDTDYAGRSWHWRQEVVATEIPGVVRIDMKVRPKEVQAGDDEAWTTTVSGICGNSTGRADGYNPNWGQQAAVGAGATLPTSSTSNTIGANATNLQISPSSSGLGSQTGSGLSATPSGFDSSSGPGSTPGLTGTPGPGSTSPAPDDASTDSAPDQSPPPAPQSPQ